MNSKTAIKKQPFRMKLIAIILILVFSFQSMSEINSHSYTTGFSNIHYPIRFTCIGFEYQAIPHMSYTCGKAFHV